MRWVWNQPEVSLLLSGMATMEEVEENVRLASMGGTSFRVEESIALANAFESPNKKDVIPCIQCGFCSCHYEVPIKEYFTIFNANRDFSVTVLSAKNYDFMLRGTGMEASLCNHCGQCGFMCP